MAGGEGLHDSLLQQLMSEQGMDVGAGLASAGHGKVANPNAAQQQQSNDFQKQLDALKNL